MPMPKRTWVRSWWFCLTCGARYEDTPERFSCSAPRPRRKLDWDPITPRIPRGATGEELPPEDAERVYQIEGPVTMDRCGGSIVHGPTWRERHTKGMS